MFEAIDIYCHWLTPKFLQRVQAAAGSGVHMLNRAGAMPVMVNLEARFRIMDKFPGYAQIPSIAFPPVDSVGPGAAPELARIANDEQAEIVARHPERFPGFVAVLVMSDIEEAKREATRAILELGAVGVQLYTNVAGRPIDTPDFIELIRHVAGLGRPIWLHPSRGIEHSDYRGERYSKYEIWWALGWPYETSAAMSRLVFAGVMEDSTCPLIVTHHGGGMIPMVEGRLTSGLAQLGTRCAPGLEHTVATTLKGSPIDSFRRFYADTATFGSRNAIASALGFFGPDHIVFASDMPFDAEQGAAHIRTTLQAISELDVSPEVRHQILAGNARRICGLSKPHMAAAT